MIDLHVHSTFSDGSFAPAELVDMAVSSGLTAMALTDHDGLGGLPQFMDACQAKGLIGIPGVEISIEFKPGTLHVLGYFIDAGNAPFAAALEDLRDGRESRNLKILQKLNELGCALSWEEVAAFAGEDVVGRPHFAQAMIAKGFVKTKEDAFDRYLAKGKPAYLDRVRLTVPDSIRLIHGAGGIAVLAHPSTLKVSRVELHRIVAELAAEGLDGIEAWYSEHTQDQQKAFAKLAEELGLILTGGSDFHGASNPEVRLGRGFGNLDVPDALLDTLYARAGKKR
jgi:predicted metal-dependent phosphoesterase TrpH